jgi:hypothetical protein
MKRKISANKENDRTTKRAKYNPQVFYIIFISLEHHLKINQIADAPTCNFSPELTDDAWFLVLAFVDSLFMISLLSSVSKAFYSLCLSYKNARSFKATQLASTAFAIHFAENGWLNCLQYLVENGVKLPESTASIAAKEGHYSCVTYACEHGGNPKIILVYKIPNFYSTSISG